MEAGRQLQVLVLGDTHVRDAARLPRAIFDAAAAADHIVHTGDHSSLDVVRVLETFAPVTAVHGNVDDPEVVAALPGVARVDLDGARFGVVHDAGASAGRHERLRARFDDCAVVAYGHSHQPEVTQLADTSWVVNPGSPTQRHRAPDHTFAWAEVRAGQVSVRLVHLALACVALLLVAGCSTGVGGPKGNGRAARKAPPPARTLELQRTQEQLLAAIAPVSAANSRVVAVVQLRDDGAVSVAVVNAEAVAQARVLARAQRALERVKPSQPETKAVHALLVRMVNERTTAVQALRQWSAPSPPAHQSELALRARFDLRWDASVGSARAATNVLQATRLRAGLAPKREDAIR